MVLLEYIADQSVGLAQTKMTIFLRHDARGILAPVLQNGERVIERLIDRIGADDSDDSAHGA